MGILVVSDNAATTLAAAITNSPTVSSLTLASGAKFPTVNHGGIGTDWSYVTLYDAAGNIETMKVTRHDNGTPTITVARGTAAGISGVNDASCLAWASGSTGVACRLIAQVVNDTFAAVTTAAAQASAAASSAATASGQASSAAASAAAAVTAVDNLLPAGTTMPFAQATAPTGWTQIVSDLADNRMLRVVKTAGAGSGGTHSPIINNVVPAHTHTITTGNMSANATHTHTVTDPGHVHGYPDHFVPTPTPGPVWSASGSWLITGGNANSATTGISLGSANVDHTHSGTTDAGSSQTNWQPRYIDMIICSKN